MNMRNGLTFARYFRNTGTVPRRMCAGLAAYLLFTKPVQEKDGRYFGELQGEPYPIKDDQTAFFYQAWSDVDVTNQEGVQKLVQQVLTHQPFWDQDMMPFIDQTAYYITEFERTSVREVLSSISD